MTPCEIELWIIKGVGLAILVAYLMLRYLDGGKSDRLKERF